MKPKMITFDKGFTPSLCKTYGIQLSKKQMERVGGFFKGPKETMVLWNDLSAIVDFSLYQKFKGTKNPWKLLYATPLSSFKKIKTTLKQKDK